MECSVTTTPRSIASFEQLGTVACRSPVAFTVDIAEPNIQYTRAPRIHAEPLKLGVDAAQSTLAKYIV